MIRLLSLLLTLCLALPALAQDARALKAEADRAYKDGDYSLALEKLDAAFEVSQNPALRANMGLVYNAMGDYASAVEAFEAFLASDPPAAKAAKAQAFIAKLMVPVTFSSTPPGAQVFLATKPKPLGTTPLEAQVVAGSHQVRFVLKGHEPRTQRLRTYPKRPAQLTVMLAPKENVVSPFAQAQRRRANSLNTTKTIHTPTPNTTWAWVAFGVAGVATGGVVVSQLLGRGAVDDRDAAQSGAVWDDAQGQVETWNTGFLVSAGVATVALGAGLALLWTQDDAPVQIGAGPSGVVVGGHF